MERDRDNSMICVYKSDVLITYLCIDAPCMEYVA